MLESIKENGCPVSNRSTSATDENLGTNHLDQEKKKRKRKTKTS